MQGLLNAVFTRFNFDLEVPPETDDMTAPAPEAEDKPGDQEPASMLSCAQAYLFRALGWEILRFTLVLLLMTADAALPTEQCYPEFLFAEVMSIGGFANICQVVFPRLTQLGITVNMRAAPFFEEPTSRGALIGIAMLIGITILGLALIVDASVQGAGDVVFGNTHTLDILYWLYPSICGFVTMAVLGVWTSVAMGDVGIPMWAAALRLRTVVQGGHVTKRIEAERNRRLSVLPPYWLQA